jgi:hypothetical protein
MEWGVFTKYVRVNESIVQNMINIFTSHNLHPFNINEEILDIKTWQEWPFEVIWRKN